MRRDTVLATIVTFLLVGPALAGDGMVAPSTLKALGLAGMQTVSDAEGMQVRGLSAAAATAGLSVVSGVLYDPNSQSFVVGADASSASACEETTCCFYALDPTHTVLSAIELTLDVTSGGIVFSGVLVGGGGGSGMAGAN